MRLVGRGFYTLIRNASFSSPTDVGSHNPPSSGPSVLAGTRSSLQSIWDLTIHPPSGPSVFADTHSSLQSMWDLTISPLSRPNVLIGTRFSLQSMWDLTIHPLQGPTSSLTLVLLFNRYRVSQFTHSGPSVLTSSGLELLQYFLIFLSFRHFETIFYNIFLFS